jgi:hypothetical protein
MEEAFHGRRPWHGLSRMLAWIFALPQEFSGSASYLKLESWKKKAVKSHPNSAAQLDTKRDDDSRCSWRRGIATMLLLLSWR